MNALPDILKKELETKWEAFKDSSEKAGIHLPQEPRILDALQRVFVLSNFVANNCIRSPALISNLIDSGDLQRRYAARDYDQKLKAILSDIIDEAALTHYLRTFRQREMLRIAFRDLCGWSDLVETVTDLSNMADTCLAQTVAILTRWLSNRYGVPIAEDGSRQGFVVLGLGKLGAGELNFSSDIDLIFTYPRTGRTTGNAKPVSNEDFFTRLGRNRVSNGFKIAALR
jgi:glutamate-ammonia-ligase adenylyltransferase